MGKSYGLFAALIAALFVAGPADAQASPRLAASFALPAGSTPLLHRHNPERPRVDGWVAIMARTGVLAGAGTGFHAELEFLLGEAIGVGYGFASLDDHKGGYWRFTLSMLDINHYLITPFINLHDSDELGVEVGVALSIPLTDAKNTFLRLSYSAITGDAAGNLFGVGLEYALW